MHVLCELEETQYFLNIGESPPEKEKEELKSVNDLFKNFNDEERQNLEEDIEEINRMGPYGGDIRPTKVLLNTQKATEEVLYRTSKLRER